MGTPKKKLRYCLVSTLSHLCFNYQYIYYCRINVWTESKGGRKPRYRPVMPNPGAAFRRCHDSSRSHSNGACISTRDAWFCILEGRASSSSAGSVSLYWGTDVFSGRVAALPCCRGSVIRLVPFAPPRFLIATCGVFRSAVIWFSFPPPLPPTITTATTTYRGIYTPRSNVTPPGVT